MPGLFDALELKGATLRNRIGMSPMCQYRAKGDGVPTDWHRTHYRSRALGGVGLIITEMTDIEPRGRITEGCLGLWNDDQRDAFARIGEDVHAEGAAFGVQIAHAGRKSTLDTEIVAPSAIPFSEDRKTPRALTVDEIESIVAGFATAAKRAVEAGVDVVEVHGAHGYLLHQFLSPLSNQRDDEYGEPSRFPLEVVEAVRAALPSTTTLMLRLSLREHQPGGYGRDHVLPLIPAFVAAGVDAFDVSTGGNGPQRPATYPGYQLSDSEAVKRAVDLPVASVGMLHAPELAEHAVREGRTDLVLIGRGLLRNPYWAHEAALQLGVQHQLPGEYAKGL